MARVNSVKSSSGRNKNKFENPFTCEIEVLCSSVNRSKR